MSPIYWQNRPALFLGIADFIESSGVLFPAGSLDLFRLSQHKSHITYPAIIGGNTWVILVDSVFLELHEITACAFRIADDSDAELAKIRFALVEPNVAAAPAPENDLGLIQIGTVMGSQFGVIHFTIDKAVERPGRYTVYLIHNGDSVPIGSVHFHYRKVQALTPDQIKAIESDPNSVKWIRMDLGCKSCPTNLKATPASIDLRNQKKRVTSGRPSSAMGVSVDVEERRSRFDT